MKKTIILAFFVIYSFITNAQIKVVADDYAATLTGSKDYYEQDVAFETIFPLARLGEQYSSYEMILPEEYNCLGDTIWNYYTGEDDITSFRYCDRMRLYGGGFGVTSDGINEEVIWERPVGYYVVSGYIIGRENVVELLSRYFSSTDISDRSYGFAQYTESVPTVKQLKEDLLVANIELLPAKYIALIRLTAIDTTQGKTIHYYANGLSPYFNVKFYTELEKHFLNKEVLLLNNNYIRIEKNGSYLNTNGDDLLSVEKDGIITDALTHEKIKVQDDAFIVKDVVVKLEKDRPSSEYGKPHLYVVLEGNNTGSFAMQANSIQYIFDIKCDMGNEVVYSSKSPFNYNIPHIMCHESYNSDFYLLRKQDLSTIKQFAIDTCNTINKKEMMDKQKEDNERIANQKRREQDIRKKQEERRLRIVSKYGEKIGALICDKKVAIGMTQEMCRDAWGRPMDTYRTTTKYGQSEIWCYNYKTRIYFYEGKVVQIDN